MRSFENVLRYLKQEGLKPFLSRAIRTVFFPVIRFQREIFYNRLLTNAIAVTIPQGQMVLVKASLTDLQDLQKLVYLPPLEIKNWLLNGKECFVVKAAEQIVHYSWISFGTEYIDVIDKTIKLAGDEAYVHTCRTLPAHRGKGIYPFMLNKISEYLKRNGYSRVIICADFKNSSSIKSFEKAEFKKIGEVTYLKLFPFSKYWYQGILPQLD